MNRICAPAVLGKYFCSRFYKDTAPTVLTRVPGTRYLSPDDHFLPPARQVRRRWTAGGGHGEFESSPARDQWKFFRMLDALQVQIHVQFRPVQMVAV